MESWYELICQISVKNRESREFSGCEWERKNWEFVPRNMNGEFSVRSLEKCENYHTVSSFLRVGPVILYNHARFLKPRQIFKTREIKSQMATHTRQAPLLRTPSLAKYNHVAFVKHWQESPIPMYKLGLREFGCAVFLYRVFVERSVVSGKRYWLLYALLEIQNIFIVI